MAVQAFSGARGVRRFDLASAPGPPKPPSPVAPLLSPKVPSAMTFSIHLDRFSPILCISLFGFAGFWLRWPSLEVQTQVLEAAFIIFQPAFGHLSDCV